MRQILRLAALLLATALGLLPAAETVRTAPAPSQGQAAFLAQVRGLGVLRLETHGGEAERAGGSWITIVATDARYAGWCTLRSLPGDGNGWHAFASAGAMAGPTASGVVLGWLP